MSDSSAQLLGVVFGWLLGIGSHFIIDGLKRRREERELRAVLRTELSELQFRMVVVVMSIEMRLGTTNRASLDWMKPIVERYDGVNADEKVLKFIKMSDEEIAIANELTRLNQDVGINLQKYSIPLLEANLSLLSRFEHNPKLQSQLLEVRSNLAMFNDLVDRAHYFLELTYAVGISPNNHARAVESQNSIYKLAATRAKVIADLIGKIRWC